MKNHELTDSFKKDCQRTIQIENTALISALYHEKSQ